MQDHSALDRLEARLDLQAARIDVLYEALAAHGLLPPESPEKDPLSDELVQVENSPLVRAAGRA